MKTIADRFDLRLHYDDGSEEISAGLGYLELVGSLTRLVPWLQTTQLLEALAKQGDDASLKLESGILSVAWRIS